MKKAKPRAGAKDAKKPSPAEPAHPKPMDLAEIRRQIADLVGNGAVGMVETTIEEVGKGHYLGMKYLFEMIGLYPATSTDDAPIQESMAATLLRRLGLPERPIAEPRLPKIPGRPRHPRRMA